TAFSWITYTLLIAGSCFHAEGRAARAYSQATHLLHRYIHDWDVDLTLRRQFLQRKLNPFAVAWAPRLPRDGRRRATARENPEMRPDTLRFTAAPGGVDEGRVPWVDTAKGACIVLVVMMHATLGVGEA